MMYYQPQSANTITQTTCPTHDVQRAADATPTKWTQRHVDDVRVYVGGRRWSTFNAHDELGAAASDGRR